MGPVFANLLEIVGNQYEYIQSVIIVRQIGIYMFIRLYYFITYCNSR